MRRGADAVGCGWLGRGCTWASSTQSSGFKSFSSSTKHELKFVDTGKKQTMLLRRTRNVEGLPFILSYSVMSPKAAARATSEEHAAAMRDDEGELERIKATAAAQQRARGEEQAARRTTPQASPEAGGVQAAAWARRGAELRGAQLELADRQRRHSEAVAQLREAHVSAEQRTAARAEALAAALAEARAEARAAVTRAARAEEEWGASSLLASASARSWCVLLHHRRRASMFLLLLLLMLLLRLLLMLRRRRRRRVVSPVVADWKVWKQQPREEEEEEEEAARTSN